MYESWACCCRHTHRSSRPSLSSQTERNLGTNSETYRQGIASNAPICGANRGTCRTLCSDGAGSKGRQRSWQKYFRNLSNRDLAEIGVVAGVYKSRRKEKAKEREAACIALCKNLKIEPYLKNDDDIDAIICAVTAVASEEYLCKSRDYKIESERLPCGYRLLKRNPFERIYVDEEDFSKWMSGHEKHA